MSEDGEGIQLRRYESGRGHAVLHTLRLRRSEHHDDEFGQNWTRRHHHRTLFQGSTT